MTLLRHFTATGFVVHEDRVLLHWHPKVREWLPPGGHIDENEDPVQAVLREVLEETGITAEVVPTSPPVGLRYPSEVTPPYTIMVEDIHDPADGYHQHIDMIYFCRLTGPPTLNDGWQWVSRNTLETAAPVIGQDGSETVPPRDVRVLGLLSLSNVASR